MKCFLLGLLSAGRLEGLVLDLVAWRWSCALVWDGSCCSYLKMHMHRFNVIDSFKFINPMRSVPTLVS